MNSISRKSEVQRTLTFGLMYNDNTETQEADSLEDLVFDLLTNEKDPDLIITPNGLQLKWHPYVANAFVCKGRIKEQEFINILMTPQRGNN